MGGRRFLVGGGGEALSTSYALVPKAVRQKLPAVNRQHNRDYSESSHTETYLSMIPPPNQLGMSIAMWLFTCLPSTKLWGYIFQWLTMRGIPNVHSVTV
jgi:hypothetical protein